MRNARKRDEPSPPRGGSAVRARGHRCTPASRTVRWDRNRREVPVVTP